MKRFILAISILALPFCLRAQENNFSLKANFLTRGEIRYGGLSAPDADVPAFAAFIIERTRLTAEYSRTGITAKVSAQHCGTWGADDSGTSFSLYEAWGMFSHKGFFAQFGRQPISYDNQRIFGSDDWAMNAITHDALRIGYEGGGHKIHLIGAFNQNPSNIGGGTVFTGGIQPYKTMQTLWYHYDTPVTGLGASLLFSNIGMQEASTGADPENVHFQQLLGAYAAYKSGRLDCEAEYYYQMGKEEHGIPLDAWMASARASWQLSSIWSFYGGYDYLSGDENFSVPAQGNLGMIRHDTIHGFSSLYGSHHKFYGAMDFFYLSAYYGGFTPGLQNAYIGAHVDSPKLFMDFSWHFLATATKIDNADKYLGNELEFSVGWKIFKDATLSAGYSFMKGTQTMEILKRTSGNDRLHWGWLMLTLTPEFFSGKW